MNKSGGLPRDTLFRKTEAPEEAPREKPNQVPNKQQVNISQSKQRDNEIVADTAIEEQQKTTEASRQTYYVPAGLHKQLKMLAIEREVNVSDLVVEGIEWVVGKYGR